jgi:hypothetical protein
MPFIVNPAPMSGGEAISFKRDPFYLLFFVDLPLVVRNFLVLPAIVWPRLPDAPAHKLSELYLGDVRNWIALAEQALLLAVSLVAIGLPVACLWIPLLPLLPLIGGFMLFYIVLSSREIVINPWKPGIPPQWAAVPNVPGETYVATFSVQSLSLKRLVPPRTLQVVLRQWHMVSDGKTRSDWQHCFSTGDSSVGRHWHRLNLYRLSHLFGRRIIGIHNRTLGILFDVLESVIQVKRLFPAS